jgi:hypothetical protein
VLQAITYRGKAALPGVPGVRLLDRFSKVFAVDGRSGRRVGRVDVGKGFVGRQLYPLYFKLDKTVASVTGASR